MKMICLAALCGMMATALEGANSGSVKMSKEVLLDKIKGGWAGQTFGCTYGGPTEFKYMGQMIPDSVEIKWSKEACKRYFERNPGLYDDVYMDLTFLEVFDKYGIDVPVDSLANAFANKGYGLWHANLVGRYHILNGMKPPMSGYWKNNPHADDIDFQIEADFAGLMTPGMPASAAGLADKVGHIMNYGDGWYGGVYVATMYSLAFVSDEMEFVVKEALKAIPRKSKYHQCISDVIGWCAQYDWKTTWRMIEDKWSANDDVCCPKGTRDPYNIDAKVNSAYVVMGLLYGKKEMEKTMDIAIRCGADSDCNPATAAGILGTMLGYSHIDRKWIDPVAEVEDLPFAYTFSLNKTYEICHHLAVEMMKRGGGRVAGDQVVIKTQKVKPVRYEQSFEGLSLVSHEKINAAFTTQSFVYEFEGTGVVCQGWLRANDKEQKVNKKSTDKYVAKIEVDIDGKKQVFDMPAAFHARRPDLYWNYDLPEGKHTMTINHLNPQGEYSVMVESVATYTAK